MQTLSIGRRGDAGQHGLAWPIRASQAGKGPDLHASAVISSVYHHDAHALVILPSAACPATHLDVLSTGHVPANVEAPHHGVTMVSYGILALHNQEMLSEAK